MAKNEPRRLASQSIPADWPGTLITDRGKSYDSKHLAAVKQQKCHAHLIRNIKETQANQPPSAHWFGDRLLELFASARDLHREFSAGEIERSAFDDRAGPIRAALRDWLRDRPLADADNQRLLATIGFHHNRDSLLRFLDDPHIEPTNNAAERALRQPVVTAKKTSQCSRSWRGAAASSASGVQDKFGKIWQNKQLG